MDSSYEYPKFLTERDENGEAYFLPQGGYEGSEGWGRVSGGRVGEGMEMAVADTSTIFGEEKARTEACSVLSGEKRDMIVKRTQRREIL